MISLTFLECSGVILGARPLPAHKGALTTVVSKRWLAALLLSFLALSGPSPMPTKSLEMLLITGADCVIQTQRVRKIASLLFIYFHESFSNSLNRL